MPRGKDPNRALPPALLGALGKTIRDLREKKHMGLVNFAADAFTDAGNISRLERAIQAPTLDTLYSVARVLGIRMYELLKLAEVGESAEKPISAQSKQIALAWEDLPDVVREDIEDRIIESMTLRRTIPTYYDTYKANPRRLSFEQKLARLPRAQEMARQLTKKYQTKSKR